VLLAGQAHPGTEKVYVKFNTLVPDFLTLHFLVKLRLPKAILQLILLVLVEQDLLLEFKPLVDWWTGGLWSMTIQPMSYV
jgi:hypothetical protein